MFTFPAARRGQKRCSTRLWNCSARSTAKNSPVRTRPPISLTNNIAEGHGRYHYPDQIRFMLQSRGSLEELVDDLNVCLDEGYHSTEKVEELKETAQSVLALLNGYLRYLRKRSSAVGEPSP